MSVRYLLDEANARIKFLELECEKLQMKLEDEKKYSRRLNLEAQRWFDTAMDLMNKEDK